MRRALLCAAILALATAATASAALPLHGRLVPGRSLGGVRLGEPAARVKAALGFHGVCRSCNRTTWYFTYKPFDRHGLAVQLDAGRVSGIWTLWQPDGWTAPGGLQLGSFGGAVKPAGETLVPRPCTGYQALVSDSGAQTVYYLFGGKLWGFGLFAGGEDPCR
jgi:hypothetical protein